MPAIPKFLSVIAVALCGFSPSSAIAADWEWRKHYHYWCLFSASGNACLETAAEIDRVSRKELLLVTAAEPPLLPIHITFEFLDTHSAEMSFPSANVNRNRLGAHGNLALDELLIRLGNDSDITMRTFLITLPSQFRTHFVGGPTDELASLARSFFAKLEQTRIYED